MLSRKEKKAGLEGRGTLISNLASLRVGYGTVSPVLINTYKRTKLFFSRLTYHWKQKGNAWSQVYFVHVIHFPDSHLRENRKIYGHSRARKTNKYSEDRLTRLLPRI